MLSLNFSHFISACLNTQMLPCNWLTGSWAGAPNEMAVYREEEHKCVVPARNLEQVLHKGYKGTSFPGLTIRWEKIWQNLLQKEAVAMGEKKRKKKKDYPHEKNRTTKLCELSYNVLAICCGWWDQIWQRVWGNTFQKRPGLKHCSMADMLNAIKVTSFKTKTSLEPICDQASGNF